GGQSHEAMAVRYEKPQQSSQPRNRVCWMLSHAALLLPPIVLVWRQAQPLRGGPYVALRTTAHRHLACDPLRGDLSTNRAAGGKRTRSLGTPAPCRRLEVWVGAG